MAKTAKIHVPETSEPQPNREQRRHPERRQGEPDSTFDSAASQRGLGTALASDAQSVRAKSSGHGKKTADKWNQ